MREIGLPGGALLALVGALVHWRTPFAVTGLPGYLSLTRERVREDVAHVRLLGLDTKEIIKQAEVDVQDGELNLSFTAVEGEPIIAAVEVLQPTR